MIHNNWKKRITLLVASIALDIFMFMWTLAYNTIWVVVFIINAKKSSVANWGLTEWIICLIVPSLIVGIYAFDSRKTYLLRLSECYKYIWTDKKATENEFQKMRKRMRKYIDFENNDSMKVKSDWFGNLFFSGFGSTIFSSILSFINASAFIGSISKLSSLAFTILLSVGLVMVLFISLLSYVMDKWTVDIWDTFIHKDYFERKDRKFSAISSGTSSAK